jgi:hypothetical protein
MKTIYTDDPLVNNELFSLATQLYVRLRRETGRVVDAVYMAKITTTPKKSCTWLHRWMIVSLKIWRRN